MQTTVIGVFDNEAAATQARTALVNAGLGQSNLQVRSLPTPASPQATGASSYAEGRDDGFLSDVRSFFAHLFGDDDDAGHGGTYTEAVRRGSHVLTVEAATDAEAQQISALLDNAGAVDIDERASQWRNEGWTGTASGAGAASSARDAVPGQAVLPVIEEELRVGKRTVQQGKVRVVRRVTETPVSESVRLTEEHATIERRPVDRPATSADLNDLRDATIEVRETAEEPVVAKQARVVEEVVVGKQASERVEQVSDTVRRTDVAVERTASSEPLGGGAASGGVIDSEEEEQEEDLSLVNPRREHSF